MSRQRVPASLSLLVGVSIALLSGCTVYVGAEETTAATPVVTVEVTRTTSARPESPTSPEPVATSSPTVEPSAGESTALYSFVPIATSRFKSYDGDRYRYEFQSPSGNLQCVIDVEFGRSETPVTGCYSYSSIANLPTCDAARGVPVIEFERAWGARTSCARELPYGSDLQEFAVLEYGERLSVEGITCTSESTGVTCFDEASGRGFTAARAAFQPIGG